MTHSTIGCLRKIHDCNDYSNESRLSLISVGRNSHVQSQRAKIILIEATWTHLAPLVVEDPDYTDRNKFCACATQCTPAQSKDDGNLIFLRDSQNVIEGFVETAYNENMT